MDVEQSPIWRQHKLKVQREGFSDIQWRSGILQLKSRQVTFQLAWNLWRWKTILTRRHSTGQVVRLSQFKKGSSSGEHVGKSLCPGHEQSSDPACSRVRGGGGAGQAGAAGGRGEGDGHRVLSGLQLVAGRAPPHPVHQRAPLGESAHMSTGTGHGVGGPFNLRKLFPLVWDSSSFLVPPSLQVIETLLFSTFVSWKTFFPLVRDDSHCTYTFITGETSTLCTYTFITGETSTLWFVFDARQKLSENSAQIFVVFLITSLWNLTLFNMKYFQEHHEQKLLLIWQSLFYYRIKDNIQLLRESEQKQRNREIRLDLFQEQSSTFKVTLI